MSGFAIGRILRAISELAKRKSSEIPSLCLSLQTLKEVQGDSFVSLRICEANEAILQFTVMLNLFQHLAFLASRCFETLKQVQGDAVLGMQYS